MVVTEDEDQGTDDNGGEYDVESHIFCKDKLFRGKLLQNLHGDMSARFGVGKGVVVRDPIPAVGRTIPMANPASFPSSSIRDDGNGIIPV